MGPKTPKSDKKPNKMCSNPGTTTKMGPKMRKNPTNPKSETMGSEKSRLRGGGLQVVYKASMVAKTQG